MAQARERAGEVAGPRLLERVTGEGVHVVGGEEHRIEHRPPATLDGAAGIIMIILGSLPKAAAIVAGIPHPVLGGAALAMFAAVAVVGVQTL